jgi:hypothetical protein
MEQITLIEPCASCGSHEIFLLSSALDLSASGDQYVRLECPHEALISPCGAKIDYEAQAYGVRVGHVDVGDLMHLLRLEWADSIKHHTSALVAHIQGLSVEVA